MKYFALIIAIYVTMVVQTSGHFSVLPTAVQVAGLTAIAVSIGCSMTDWRGVVMAAVTGLLADIISPGPIGVELLLLTLFAFGVQLLRSETANEPGTRIKDAGQPGFLRLAVTVFIGVFLVRLIATTIDQAIAGVAAEPISVATQTLLAAVFFSIVIPAVYTAWQFSARLILGDSLPDSTTPTDRWLASSG